MRLFSILDFGFMNCFASRACNLINYLPIIGTFKSLGEAIIAKIDGENDEATEMFLLFIISAVCDYFTFGMLKFSIATILKSGFQTAFKKLFIHLILKSGFWKIVARGFVKIYGKGEQDKILQK
jgi:hypothetical protein